MAGRTVIPDEAERRMSFESLVCQALWLLILFAAGRRAPGAAEIWRGNAISYFDVHGRQGEDAKRIRRERGFPPLES